MSKKRPATIEASKKRNNRVLWLSHVELLNEDIEWLDKTERLTLLNVKVPVGLLSKIPGLWWLDFRGGSAADLSVAAGTDRLQYLAINQVRGLCDLSTVGDMVSLRYLDLFGLPKVIELPSCARLDKLEHVTIGQMSGLVSFRGLLEAPNLREMQLIKKVNVSENDVSQIIRHPSIKAFGWYAEDVPSKIWVPVLKKIGLPTVPLITPEAWFKLPESAGAV